MDLGSGQRERSFDMPLSDLGEPDFGFVPWRVLSELGMSNGSSDGDPGLAKWTVQEAVGGVPRPEFMSMEGDGFCVHVEGHESEPHEVEVHFTGKLLDGTVFASSGENDIPLTFKLTKDNVMEGFRLAITSMQAGEKAVFTIPQALAVTRSGCPANIPWNIPTNQTLRFDIELISVITDIFGDQGVIKKTIKFGTGNKLSLDLVEVLVKYNACLEDGSSVSKSEGVEFSLAEGFFCSAFAHVVKTMTAGEEAIVVIKPEYGFGERGRPATGNKTAVPPNATLHVNLQLISWKIVTHIGENRDIVKRRHCKGNSVVGGRPRNGAVVKVRLIGKLQDGTVFDRRGHNGDDPFEFTIDEEHVIYGLDEAVMTMAQGEVASFTIPPQHAFGAVGSNQYPLAVIPPNSVVTYEIELLSVENEEPLYRKCGFPDESVISVARKKEHEGDDLFNLGKYLRAYRRYLRARQILRSTLPRQVVIDHLMFISYDDECPAVKLQRCEQAFDDVKEILISLALKSADCAMQLQRYKQAFDCYHEVLEYDPGNLKALQMVAQSFPKTPVAIDANAMHRGLKEELEELKKVGLTLSSGSVGRVKYRHEASEGRIFVPPFARPDQANASQAVPTAPTTNPVTPEASPVGSVSNSSTTGNENQSSGATRGERRASLGSCFGFSSSN